MKLKLKVPNGFEHKVKEGVSAKGPYKFGYMTGAGLTDGGDYCEITIPSDKPLDLKPGVVELVVLNMEAVGESGTIYTLRGKVA